MRKKSLIVGTILFLGVLFLFQSPAVASCDYGKGKITSISPATLSTGDVLTIEGTGFGEINHFHINKSNTRCNGSVNVVYDYMGNIVAPLGCSMNDTLGWEWSKIISWSDNKIEIQIPDTFEDPQTTNVKTALDKNIDTFGVSIVVKEFEFSGYDGIVEIYEEVGSYEICGDPFYGSNSTFTYRPSCTTDTWSCSNWGICSTLGEQTRTCNKTFDCLWVDTPSEVTRECTPNIPVPVITFISPAVLNNYNDLITINGENLIYTMDDEILRFTNYTSPDYGSGSIVNGDPGSLINIIEWTDTTIKLNLTERMISNFAGVTSWDFKINFNDYNIGEFNYSNEMGVLIKPIVESVIETDIFVDDIITISGLFLGNQTETTITINNTPVEITDWSSDRYSRRILVSMKVPDISSGNLILTTPEGVSSDPVLINITKRCTEDTWTCSDWATCSKWGTQTRTCNKSYDCPSAYTPSPATSQSCTYTPPCTQDTWECGSWGTCSPQGIKTRSCTKTYECPSVESALPSISQYCEAPNQPKYQTPSDNLEITNQDSIIKSTVKLLCPVDRYRASQGSGTVIDSEGTILTNEHVIKNTYGCFVGFIDDYDDEPFFNYTRQIADIEKFSNSTDVAILKLRNPYSRNLTSIDITKGNSNNLTLGDTITTYGYPAKFGTKITYTSGDFSGVNGDYLKTTAILDSGNSGGGAYLRNGTFIGIPSRVSPGNYNIMGEVLSINKINSWLNNSTMAYNYDNNNQYSRVSSFLEDFDLSTLDSLSLYIASEEEKYIDNTKSNSQKVTEQERKLITKVDKNLSRRVSGTILLQVESVGEAWYVYPDNHKKHYLGRPADAFSIMRGLGLGITNTDLNKIPKSDENFTGDYNMRKRLSGKILLQVEEHGEAWYIYPKDLKRYYMGRPSDAFELMRGLGLGITNSDLRKIDVGEVE